MTSRIAQRHGRRLFHTSAPIWIQPSGWTPVEWHVVDVRSMGNTLVSLCGKYARAQRAYRPTSVIEESAICGECLKREAARKNRYGRPEAQRGDEKR